MTVARSARWKAAAVALGAGLLVAACGSGGLYGGGSSSGGATSAAASPATSPTSVLCQHAAALRDSLDELKHVNVGPGVADEIKTDVADVRSKLNALTAEAHGQAQAQTSALKAELAKLQTAASDLAANPSADSVAGVATALRGVAGAGSSLLAAVSKDCPSASASPSM